MLHSQPLQDGTRRKPKGPVRQAFKLLGGQACDSSDLAYPPGLIDS